MKTLSRHLQEYLTLRRQLGFKLYVEGSLLHSFVRFAQEQKARFINTKLALRWATLPTNIRQRQRARRLAMVRGFAGYLKMLEPRTEVPAQKLLPFRSSRPEPYLYSEEQVLHLIETARRIAPSSKIKGVTLGTLLGLLTVTGMLYSSELIRGVWSGVVCGGTGLMSWLGRGADGWLVCREDVVQGCG